MARSVLEIVYKLAKQGNADRETLQGIKNLDKGAKALKATFSQFAVIGASIASVGYGVKKAFDLGKEGAELLMMRERFDNLSESIGTTSDALLSDLSTATRGLYTESQLVASATDLMGLGLAKTHDEAVRLAAVASALNMNMNQLVLTLTNQTTMRFDSLNVSVDGFKENLKALQDQGYDTNAAFTEAFLQQAEGQIEKVGHAADSALGPFLQLEAQAKRLGETIKQDLANELGPFVDDLVWLVDHLSESGNGFEENKIKAEGFMRVIRGITTLGLSEIISGWVEGEKEMIDTMQVLERAGLDVNAMTVMYGGNLKQAAAETQRASEYGRAWERALAGQAAQLDTVTEAIEDNSAANQGMFGLIEQLQSENDKYNESLAEVNSKFEEAGYVQDLYKQSQKEFLADARAGKITWEEYSASVRQLSLDYQDGTFAAEEQSAATAALAAQHEDASRRIAYSLLQQKAASDGLTDAEFQGLLAVGEQWGIIDQTVVDSALVMDREMQAMADSFILPNARLTDMVGKFQNLDKRNGQAWDFYVNVHTSGSFSGFGGGAGGGSGGGYNPMLADPGNYDPSHDTFASGGDLPLGQGWAMVGEQGFELIDPSGHVWTNEESRNLLRAGLTPEDAMGFGGELGSSIQYTSGYTYTPSTYYTKQKQSNKSSPSSTVVNKEITQASEAAASQTAALTDVASAALAGSASVQQSSVYQTQQLVSSIMQTSEGMVTQQQETNRLLRDQGRTMPRTIAAAIQQANP
jgi:hypothetical protein